MYCNLTRSQAFPLAVRFSLRPRCIRNFHTSKPKSLPIGFSPKLSLNPICHSYEEISGGFGYRSNRLFNLVTSTKFAVRFHSKSVEVSSIAKLRRVSKGFRLRGYLNCPSSTRCFSSLYSQRVGEGSSVERSGKPLPWLASTKAKEVRRLEKGTNRKTSPSSWEESAKRLEKVGDISSWEKPAKKLEEVTITKTGRSSWEESAKAFPGINVRVGDGENRNRKFSVLKNHYGADHIESDEVVEEENEEELGDTEDVVDDPRWDKIKDKVKGTVDLKSRPENPEIRKWNRQEAWGRKTWKEATESTVPKLVGEGVYGIGPVLAALSAERREFYALYAQEGLDLSGNNKKKKDKKGFDRILKIAAKIGLTIKETSKHDLNMVVNNRPHQGLLLDASPLEMVKIKELDPISSREEKGSLWVALDEVTDPQNLGAIIRSAYFFGASGVVLCAKNSAPLSGVVSKASAGSLELMELRYCKNMMQFLVSSSENGWRVLGASVSSKAIPLNEVSPGTPTILVLGSEGTGLRPLVERSCTQLVRIPGINSMDVLVGRTDDTTNTEVNSGCLREEFQSFVAVESLNVSVAAGVFLHHFIGNGGNNSVVSNTGS